MAVAVNALALRASTVDPPADGVDVLTRFLALDDAAPAQSRALRRLDATSPRFNSTAWMDVWTESDATGFRYQIVAEGGSSYIRSRVFRATLETEQRAWKANDPARAGVTTANYKFAESEPAGEGLTRVKVKPRRQDLLLVDGSIFLREQDADLVRIEGRLSKSPSFWTRGVRVVREYERIAGMRVPVSLETSSNLLLAGSSRFTMRWDYESVNGQTVGEPQPRAAADDPDRR